MTWSDVTREPKPSVVRQFGVVCLVVFGGLGLFLALGKGKTGLGWGLAGFGVVCLVTGLALPALFRWFYTGMMLLAFPIGFMVSMLMLTLLFFVVFLGVGLVMRLRGWDAMARRRRPAGESYWQTKVQPQDPVRYLRQY